MDNREPVPAVTPLPPAAPRLRDRKGRTYEPAVGRRLKVLLVMLFVAFSLLAATGAYQATVTLMEKLNGQTYTNAFTLWIVLAHVALGLAIILPYLFFGVAHYISARSRPNRRAVNLGLAVFAAGVLVCASGVALMQLEGLPKLPSGLARGTVYVLHILAPLACVGLYLRHRQAGPRIQWKYAYVWGGLVGGFIAIVGSLHYFDPRPWHQTGSAEGAKYFEPSLVRTPSANFIPADVLMMDEYCQKCHPDIYNDHLHSAHRLSSFNNPLYKFSVKETRAVALKRDGSVRASRWCAGCHDAVPFLSGQFDDPNYDIDNHPTASAGITCTVCHAITNVDGTVGNASFTIEEPQHYPFARSENGLLQWVNNQMVKAKPDFHKKTFLKDFHRTSEFCATCHKVSLPGQVTHYKEWLRGQNHYDPFLLSGVSGGNARAFYYPEKAKNNCADCHMPTKSSDDIAARDFDASGQRKIHNHLFPGANTGLPWLLSLDPKNAARAEGLRKAADAQADFLKDKKLRIDLFGVREGSSISGKLIAPIRPELPALKPGQTYLLEAVIRTLGVGHLFSQGTVDSNEIWVDVEAKSGGRIIGRSGALDGPNETGPVDEWAHFVNVLMLDRDGQRIDRRNAQDIFTPLYNHQIPPGAANVVHYELTIPKDISAPLEINVRLRYRKFDFEYMSIVHGVKDKSLEERLKTVPNLPIVDLCEDHVTLPIEGIAADGLEARAKPAITPAWQRWNDYGIGNFLTAVADDKKAGLLQAVQAFEEIIRRHGDDPTARAHAYLNLARAYERSGDREANGQMTAGKWLEKLRADSEASQKAPWWTVAWLAGRVSIQNNRIEEGIKNFEEILNPDRRDPARGFDFTRDYELRLELATALFLMSQGEEDRPARDRWLTRAAQEFEKVLEYDVENLDAHYRLSQCYGLLAGSARPASAQPTASADEVRTLATKLVDATRPESERIDAARQLAAAIEALAKKDSDVDQPKLPILTSLLKQVRPSHHVATDGPVKEAEALVLSRLHLAIHGVYKPDENANNETTQTYRDGHPAANKAARAVKMYTLK
jgi:tetratricopeptide (TPR) repeat protein